MVTPWLTFEVSFQIPVFATLEIKKKHKRSGDQQVSTSATEPHMVNIKPEALPCSAALSILYVTHGEF